MDKSQRKLKIQRYFDTTSWRTMELGQRFVVSHRRLESNWDSMTILRLIKVTSKGFNLLNEETGQCVLPRHLYPSKSTFNGYDKPMSFRVPNYWTYRLIDNDMFECIRNVDWDIHAGLLNHKNSKVNNEKESN